MFSSQALKDNDPAKEREILTKPSLTLLVKQPRTYFRYLNAYRKQRYYEAESAAKKDPATSKVGSYLAWDNAFPNLVIGQLLFIRTIVTEPLLPKLGIKSIIPPQQDAFWTVSQVTQWIDHTFPSWLTYPFNKVGDGIRWLLKQNSVAAALTYIPVIGLGIHALLTLKAYYNEKNKNISNTLKMIADVASSVLLAVGLGLIQWGTVAVALYCAPYLIMTAAALVVTVGLVRSFYHIYQAYRDPAHCRQHLINAVKEFLCTFINAAGFVLTLFGMQAGQKLQQFNIQKMNFHVLADAGEIYKKTVALTNAVLAAVATLVVMKLVPMIYRGLTYLGDKISQLRGKKTAPLKQPTHSISSNETEKTQLKQDITNLKNDITNQLKKLNAQIDISKKNHGYISNQLNAIRTKKIIYLTQIKNTLENETIHNPHHVLVALEQAELHQGTHVYQSFFCVKGKTETLVERSLELTKQAAAHRPPRW